VPVEAPFEEILHVPLEGTVQAAKGRDGAQGGQAAQPRPPHEEQHHLDVAGAGDSGHASAGQEAGAGVKGKLRWTPTTLACPACRMLVGRGGAEGLR
jgi:hypothetical protein